MDSIGGLFDSLARAITGLFGGMVRAFGDAVQGVFDVFQSVLPGLWLPAIGIAIVLIVGWRLAKS
ncbi:MAG TPA: hypothetical protein VF971_05480 [Candidatus Limnocylindrales bacterium]